MKKRVFCFVLALTLMCSLTALADRDTDAFFRHFKYGSLTEYENMAFHYSIGVYGKFNMYNDDVLSMILEEIDENASEDEDAVYDLRLWISRDRRYEFQIQVKEPTYESFEIEVEKAPEYAAIVADNYEPEAEMKQVHDGILRDTPMGQMLETAVSYIEFDGAGNRYPVVFVYYDCYYEGVEYIFGMKDYQGDYDSTQSMLDEMMQTVQIGTGGVSL